ncbi:MAG: hypothetical protein E1N59_831 [Puniceicoccaceae bacterium 5H]|nr:MAG: hypothetical protein E1N59_831 [Puniceicoccaceae bacterium 5H]
MKSLQVRVPDDLREQADAVLDEIGLDMSTAIRVYLKKIVQSRSIPFSLEASGYGVAEEVPVDDATQSKMDAVAAAWKRVRD